MVYLFEMYMCFANYGLFCIYFYIEFCWTFVKNVDFKQWLGQPIEGGFMCTPICQ